LQSLRNSLLSIFHVQLILQSVTARLITQTRHAPQEGRRIRQREENPKFPGALHAACKAEPRAPTRAPIFRDLPTSRRRSGSTRAEKRATAAARGIALRAENIPTSTPPHPYTHTHTHTHTHTSAHYFGCAVRRRTLRMSLREIYKGPRAPGLRPPPRALPRPVGQFPLVILYGGVCF